MKRLFLSMFAIAAACSFSFAQRGGIVGSITSSNTNIKEFNTSSVSQYFAGVAYQFNLFGGLSLQPSIQYHVKGVTLDKMIGSSFTIDNFETKVGFIELPVQIQWGPDLLAFRPYLFAEPFVGYGINTENRVNVAGVTETKWKFEDSAMERLEYGLGVGAGIQIWKIQLSAKYFWNFGSLYKEGESSKDVTNKVAQTVKDAFINNKNFNGVAFSLALFF